MVLNITGCNFHGPIELPVSVRCIFRSAARHVYFKVVEIVGDFGIAAGQPVIKAMKHFYPVIRIVYSLSHSGPLIISVFSVAFAMN